MANPGSPYSCSPMSSSCTRSSASRKRTPADWYAGEPSTAPTMAGPTSSVATRVGRSSSGRSDSSAAPARCASARSWLSVSTWVRSATSTDGWPQAAPSTTAAPRVRDAEVLADHLGQGGRLEGQAAGDRQQEAEELLPYAVGGDRGEPARPVA